MVKSNEYQQALNIINSVAINEQVYINVSSVPNFRKYLSEIIFKQKVNNQYTTRLENKGLKVVRIR